MLDTTLLKTSLVSVLKGPKYDPDDAPVSEAEKATFLSVNVSKHKQKLFNVIEVEVQVQQQGEHFTLKCNCVHDLL